MDNGASLMGRHKCRPALGTFVEISFLPLVASMDVCDEIIEIGFEKINQIQYQMSFHSPQSELSKINRLALQQAVPISAEMLTVLQTAMAFSKQTDGLFDISIGAELVRRGRLPDHMGRKKTYDPSANWTDIDIQICASGRATDLGHPASDDGHAIAGKVRFAKNMCIDLGGIAKGFAVDAAFDAMFDRAIKMGVDPQQIIVNAGGDLRQLNWQGREISVRIPVGFGGVRYEKHIMQGPAMAVSIAGHGHLAGEIINPNTKVEPRSNFWSGLKWLSNPNVQIEFDDLCMMADAKTKIKSLS